MGVTIAGNFGGQQPPTDGERPDPQIRKLILTPASTIKPRRVRWIWDGRIAEGTIALLAGREGLGKSTLAYDIAAQVTRGTLEGEYRGRPRSVLVCASEDSWEHTIVPRLIAAGADLNRMYRVEIERYDGLLFSLSLPRDFKEVEEAAELVDAGLMVLDPLMSVIDSRLDTHKDREVRAALEPLARLADTAKMAIVGLIHHNKSGSTDALQLVMGSKAFSAVARSVHTCIPDPDDETGTRRLFATSKNNLGRLDLPVLGFTITSHAVETEDDGTAWTGRLNWTGEVEGSMHEIMTRTADPERGATADAAQWLEDYLTEHGGEVAKVDIEKAGRVAGHAPRTLQRARERLRLAVSSAGFPRRTYWALPGSQIERPQDVTEPIHQRDHDDADDPTGTPGDRGTTASRANPDGTTADPSHSRANETDDPLPLDSDAKSRQDVAQLGTTGPDLQKHNPSRARAHTRAGGDGTTGTTGETAPLQAPVVPSPPVVPRPPAHAREDQPEPIPWSPPPDLDIAAPTCDDCGWPIDTTQHATTCEETP